MKIGFIGLGIMGKPMSLNLLKAGYDLVVYNRSKEIIEELVNLGAEKANSPKEVAQKADVIITMLPNSADVLSVCLGENGIIEGIIEGKAVIDMSSIDPLKSREIGQFFAMKNVDFLDAPVSGGEPKAIDGTISVMVGGEESVFDKYYDLIKSMAGTVTYLGKIGAGNIAKLANQIIVALNIAAVSEAFTLATKAGINPELLYQAIRGGLAGSTVLDGKAPLIMDRNFDPGFRIDLHMKDLKNVLESGNELGVSLPLTALIMEIMKSLKADGNEKDDHSGIIKYYEKINNTTVKRY